MSEFWGLIIASAIGALAWIYQRTWDRQEVRIERYQAIIDLLSGFTQDHLSPDEIDEAFREIRRLWLFAPDDVIKAGNRFIEAAEKGETKRSTLAEFVLAMRRDSSFTAAVVPRFFRNKLEPSDVSEMKTAKRPRSRARSN
jgi:hypothetical protein